MRNEWLSPSSMGTVKKAVREISWISGQLEGNFGKEIR